jgi:hypothetical protein
MKLSKLKHLIKPAENEKLSDALIRQIGFAGVAVVEIILNVNFFNSLGESWVMPFAGGILVFMEVWHWVSAQSAIGIRKLFHYTAWLAIALTSIIAIVSFGQAITSISSADVTQAVSMEQYKDQTRQILLQSALQEKTSTQLQIDDIIRRKSEIGNYDKGPAERLETQLTEARRAMQEIDNRILLYSGISETAESTSGGAISEASVKKNISARLIFSQIFSEEHAETAIKWFFIVFGIAMELTLSLASMPPKKDKKKKKQSILELILSKRALRPEPVPSPIQQQMQPVIVMQQPMQQPIMVAASDSQPALPPVPPIPDIKPPVLRPPVVSPPSLQVPEDEMEEVKDVDLQLHEIAREDVEEVVEKTAEVKKPHVESETAFLYTPDDKSQLKTLDVIEKGGFISNIQSIFNEIKRSGDKELSIKEISDKTNIQIGEIKRMFKFFHNRNLLTYDEMVKRWKFKLSKDNIINYLKDKSIQY